MKIKQMKQMMGMDEEQMQRAAKSGQFPGTPKQKVKKGKGKNKGGFRI